MRGLASAVGARASAFKPLLLGLAVAATFGILAWAPIAYDDLFYLRGTPLVTGVWPGWAAILTKPMDYLEVVGTPSEAYEPINTLLHRWLYGLAGEQPLLYRLSSLLLHWLNILLVWGLFRRALREERLAFLGALLFAVYPAHVETLAISAFKKHLLTALLCLATLWLQSRPLPEALLCPLSWTMFGVGLLNKESAVIIPLSVLVWEYGEGGSGLRRRWRIFAGYGALCLAYWLWRRHLGPIPGRPPAGGDWGRHFLDCAAALAWYLSQLAWPWNLCLEHSLRVLPAGPSAGTTPAVLFLLLAAILAAGLGAVLLRLLRRDRVAWIGAAWTLACLLPFLNVVPVMNYSLVADRYLYLAHAGFCLLLMRGLAVAGGRLGPRLACGLRLAPALMAAAYFALAVRRGALFADPLELWTRTAACAPDNPRAHLVLESVCLQRGLYPEAERELLRLQELHLSPHAAAAAYQDLSRILYETGRVREAVAAAERRVRLSPDAVAWLNLGAYLMRAGDAPRALAALRNARRLDPASPEISLNLGNCLLALGRWRESQRALTYALRLPELRAAALRGLGEWHLRQGLRRPAADYFAASLAAEPVQIETVRELVRLRAALGEGNEARKVCADILAAADDLRRRLEASGDPSARRTAALIASWRREIAAAAARLPVRPRRPER